MAGRIVTINKLKEIINPYNDIIPISSEYASRGTYCPTYQELMSGQVCPVATSTSAGIKITSYTIGDSATSYRNSQLVCEADIQVVGTVTLTISGNFNGWVVNVNNGDDFDKTVTATSNSITYTVKPGNYTYTISHPTTYDITLNPTASTIAAATLTAPINATASTTVYNTLTSAFTMTSSNKTINVTPTSNTTTSNDWVAKLTSGGNYGNVGGQSVQFNEPNTSTTATKDIFFDVSHRMDETVYKSGKVTQNATSQVTLTFTNLVPGTVVTVDNDIQTATTSTLQFGVANGVAHTYSAYNPTITHTIAATDIVVDYDVRNVDCEVKCNKMSYVGLAPTSTGVISGNKSIPLTLSTAVSEEPTTLTTGSNLGRINGDYFTFASINETANDKVATVTAVCFNATSVTKSFTVTQKKSTAPKITGYTITIDAFSYANVSADGGTSGPKTDYSVIANYSDGHKEVVTDSVPVNKVYTKTSGEGTVDGIGNVKYEENPDPVVKDTTVSLTVSLVSDPSVKTTANATCRQNKGGQPAPVSVVTINDVSMYIGDEPKQIEVNPSEATVGYKNTSDANLVAIRDNKITGVKVGEGGLIGSYPNYNEGEAAFIVKDKISIREKKASTDPNQKVIIPFTETVYDKSTGEQANNFFIAEVNGKELGNITWTVSTGNANIKINSQSALTDSTCALFFDIIAATTTIDKTDSITVTCTSDNPYIESDSMQLVILPKPDGSRYFLQAYDTTWNVDNYGPVKGKCQTKFYRNGWVREFCPNTAFTSNVIQKIGLEEVVDVYRIDRFDLGGGNYVYKGPFLQPGDNDNMKRYNCGTCCNGFQRNVRVIQGKEQCFYAWPSGYYYKGSTGNVKGPTDTGSAGPSVVGEGDGDQEANIIVNDNPIGSQDIIIQYSVQSNYRSSGYMATKEWFDGVGMTDRTIPTADTRLTLSYPLAIWDTVGTIKVPAGSYAKNGTPSYDEEDFLPYILSFKSNLTQYERIEPQQGLDVNIGETKTVTLYSYEFDSKTEGKGGPEIGYDFKGLDTSKVTITTSGYNASTHSITFNIKGLAKVNHTSFTVNQKTDNNDGDSIIYWIDVV